MVRSDRNLGVYIVQFISTGGMPLFDQAAHVIILV